MNSINIKHIVRFLILGTLQVFLFSGLPIFNYGLGFIYLFFLLFLPISWPKYVKLLIGFSTGLMIDFLTGTYGIHAIAATCIIVLKEPILRLILPQYNDEEWESINLYDRSMFEFSAYALIMSFIYSVIFYLLNFFSFKMPFETIYYILGSTLFTFVLLFLYRYIFATNSIENG